MLYSNVKDVCIVPACSSLSCMEMLVGSCNKFQYFLLSKSVHSANDQTLKLICLLIFLWIYFHEDGSQTFVHLTLIFIIKANLAPRPVT